MAKQHLTWAVIQSDRTSPIFPPKWAAKCATGVYFHNFHVYLATHEAVRGERSCEWMYLTVCFGIKCKVNRRYFTQIHQVFAQGTWRVGSWANGIYCDLHFNAQMRFLCNCISNWSLPCAISKWLILGLWCAENCFKKIYRARYLF